MWEIASVFKEKIVVDTTERERDKNYETRILYRMHTI